MRKPTAKKVWTVLVVLCLYAYLAHRLVDFEQWQGLQLVTSHTGRLTYLLILQLVLLSFNILLEALKWRFIINPVRHMTLTEAIETTLAAMALGNITPARTGEHVGRIAWLPKHQRSLSVALSLLSSIIQTIVIVMALVLSLPFIIGKTAHAIDLKIIVGTTLTMVAVVVLMFGVAILLIRKTKIRYSFLKVRMLFSRKIVNLRYLSVTFSLSALRYVVFGAQLIIMIHALQPGIDVLGVTALVPTYFFCITIIPSFFLADIGIKGSVALFIFATIPASELSILTAMFLIWIINSAIPTVLGNMVIAKKQIK